MPSLLTRSKSLRLLKGNRRGTQREETQTQNSIAASNASPTDFDRFKAATPVPKAEQTLDLPEMVARPSTSGGPGERPMQFHKKTMPAPSVYSQDRFLAFSSPTNSSAVLHAVNSPEEVIGIALGSPTVGSHWNSTPQATTENLIASAQMSLHSHENASTTTITGPQQQPKPKVSRWKSLFKKTVPPPKEKPSFYQLVQQATPTRADSHHDTSPKSTSPQSTSPQSKSRPTLKTERGVTLPVSVYNPDIRGSRTKSQENLSSNEARHGRKRSKTFDAGPSAPRHRFQRSATTPNPPPAGTGLLDVAIPDTTLDRYSVMFSELLQPSTKRSSLYQRRQEKADNDKAKPLDNIAVKKTPITLAEPKLQRRATSPTVSNPPSARLSLFPATGRATPTLRAGTPVLRAPSPLIANSPRARSKTAPPKSPTHQTFKATEEGKRKPPSTSVTRQYMDSPSLAPQQTPLTPSSIHSFETSDNESVTILVGRAVPAEAKAWKAHVESQEPTWEIVPKPRSASASASANRSTSLERPPSRKQPRVTVASALSSHPSSAPLDIPSPLQNLQQILSPPLSAGEFETATVEKPIIKRATSQRKTRVVGPRTQTATVGIARSVSVSKATRPRTLMRGQADLEKGSPNSETKLGDGMALMPMLVEIGNRKSQRVQLVNV